MRSPAAFHNGQPGASSGLRPRRRAKQSGGAFFEFLWRNILLVGRDPPAVPERVLEFAAAIAVELIRDRPENLQPRANRTDSIDILDIEVDHDRRPANRLRRKA